MKKGKRWQEAVLDFPGASELPAEFWAGVYRRVLESGNGYDPERGVFPWMEKDAGIRHRVVNLGPFGGNWNGQNGGFPVWVVDPEEAEVTAALLGKSLREPNVRITYLGELPDHE